MIERLRTPALVRWAIGGLFGLGLTFLGAPSAEAVTRTVPTSPGCGTIQDCVNTSADGDIIRVEPGVYIENVTVDKRVVIHGTSLTGPVVRPSTPSSAQRRFADRRCGNREAVIVDAAPGGARGIGFDIVVDGVSLMCMTIRQSDNAVQAIGVNFTSLEHINGLFSDTEVIDILGDNTLLYMSGFAGSGDGFDGVVVTGNNTRILNVVATNMGLDCIEADGDNVLVQKSRVSECENADGFDTDGDAPKYIDNLSDNVNDNGIQVVCDGDCGRARIERNVSTRARVNGFALTNNEGLSTGRMLAIRNQAVRNQENGFSLAGAFITFGDLNDPGKGNRADTNGTGDILQANILVIGTDNRIYNNLARYGGNDGIQVAPGADRNDLRKNKTIENAKDGIDNEGDDTEIRTNTSQQNEGEGLENNGASANFQGNVSDRNRIDCANDGTLDPAPQGNKCGDGSNFAPPPEVEVVKKARASGNTDEDRVRTKKDHKR